MKKGILSGLSIPVWRPLRRERALNSFEGFPVLPATIPHPRRADGELCKLPHVLLFSTPVEVA